jgi:hypothetical protein
MAAAGAEGSVRNGPDENGAAIGAVLLMGEGCSGGAGGTKGGSRCGNGAVEGTAARGANNRAIAAKSGDWEALGGNAGADAGCAPLCWAIGAAGTDITVAARGTAGTTGADAGAGLGDGA